MAGIVPVVSVRLELPMGALTLPPQVLLAGPEMVTPSGNASVNGEVRLAAVPLGLLNVTVSTETPPAMIVGWLKDLPTTGGAFTGGPAHEGTDTVFVSNVTAPFCASALPAIAASVLSVILASASMLPIKLVRVPKVAELPTCQNTLHSCALLMRTTDASLAVIRVLPILKIKVAVGSPPASRVSAPVIAAEDAKQ